MRIPRVLLTRRRFLYGIIILAVLYLFLAIPSAPPSLPPLETTVYGKAFVWNQDTRWDSLEAKYIAVRVAGCGAVSARLERGLKDLEVQVSHIAEGKFSPAAPEFGALEERFFSLAPLVGACPRNISEYLAMASHIRAALKQQSEQWDFGDRKVRETLYRILYGTRSAVEEAILQAPKDEIIPPLLRGVDEHSSTPSARFLGVTVHSGDILVSRGGAPTSALIARGNDFPGNFSHIALVHVDSTSGRLSIIESHIERGVVVSSPEQYMQDTKLRIMVLRLRSDLPLLNRDSLLPHRAASFMLERALEEHIPYDFSMDCADTTQLFCSEVASSAYRAFGIRLWMGMSHISSGGVRSWLADFGVTHFETQEPSDLEYDPQLSVVAEWRDVETLRKDHIDNAVTEAMLEGAERGERLRYDWYMLPIARVVKAYSFMLNVFGIIGPIPEGMTATTALKHKYYVARHTAAVASVQHDAAQFGHDRGIQPPYWELLRMARNALVAGKERSS